MIKKQNYLIITSSVKRAAAIGSGIKLNINQVRHQYSNEVRGNSHKKIQTHKTSLHQICSSFVTIDPVDKTAKKLSS